MLNATNNINTNKKVHIIYRKFPIELQSNISDRRTASRSRPQNYLILDQTDSKYSLFYKLRAIQVKCYIIRFSGNV